MTTSLRIPILALSSLAAAPFLLSFALSPRSARHPYLLYTSLLAVLSATAPSLLSQPPAPVPAGPGPVVKKPSSRAMMEASYDALGDVHSEGELASEEELEDVNGEEVRASVEGAAKAYVVRTGIAALGFIMAVVGIWGDGVPQTTVYVS